MPIYSIDRVLGGTTGRTVLSGCNFIPSAAGDYNFTAPGGGTLRGGINLSSLPITFTFSSGGFSLTITVETADSREASGTWVTADGMDDEDGSWQATANPPLEDGGRKPGEA